MRATAGVGPGRGGAARTVRAIAAAAVGPAWGPEGWGRPNREGTAATAVGPGGLGRPNREGHRRRHGTRGGGHMGRCMWAWLAGLDGWGRVGWLALLAWLAGLAWLSELAGRFCLTGGVLKKLGVF